MRTCQIGVRIFRYGNQIPKDYDEQLDSVYDSLIKLKRKRRGETDENSPPYFPMSIYADTNNYYEALCAAYNEAFRVISHYDHLPKAEDDHRYENGGYNLARFSMTLFKSEDPFYDGRGSNERSFSSEASSQNVYEALVMAFNDLLDKTREVLPLPVYGRRERVNIE